MSRRRPAIALLGLCATVALAGCGSHHAAPTPAPSTPVTTMPPTTSPPTTPAPQVDPLTGGRPSKNAAVATKIDDTANGRPQLGVDKADIVYIEQAEGGLTRLVAVFHTTLPEVEPVRSTRNSDPELLAQYGPIGYAISGGADSALATLARSPLKTTIDDENGPGFHRDYNRSMPYNLVANLKVAAAALKAPGPRGIGFVWSKTAPPGGSRGTSLTTVVGNTQVRFTWDAKTNRYQRVIGGVVQHAADGAVISTPNVLVQYCSVTTDSGDVDVNGSPAQFTHTTGTGKVVVFRGGHRYAGTWSRPDAASGTSLVGTGGAPISLRPGGAWVVLVAKGAPLT